MEEMTVSKSKEHNSEGTGVLPRAEIVHDEHPLSLGKTSVWNQYFQVTLTKIKIYLLLDASKFALKWYTLDYPQSGCCLCSIYQLLTMIGLFFLI